MNAFGALFLVAAVLLTWCLPRRLAALPLLTSALYMTEGQWLDIGGAHFTQPRLIILAGLLRILVRREVIAGGLQTVDKLMLLWGALIMVTSIAHQSSLLMFRTGLVWTELGAYLLFRVFLQDLEDVAAVLKAIAVVFAPVAGLLLYEKQTGWNPYSLLGGVNEWAAVRNDSIRAAGPFSHAILAGTAGASAIGFAWALWSKSAPLSVLCAAMGLAIVYASTSSGPVLMVVFVCLGMAAWLCRDSMGWVRTIMLSLILALALIMKAPIYFLIARIDIVGGSQGWFRAKLIDSSIDHLSEWWLAGTDYTRHWMATGIAANENHTDMTNHFLSMGVTGGLPLMLSFMGVVAVSFYNVGVAVRQREAAKARNDQLFSWALGALLFGFILNFLSITLFDQSVMFFWLTVASIAATRAQTRRAPVAVRRSIGTAASNTVPKKRSSSSTPPRLSTNSRVHRQPDVAGVQPQSTAMAATTPKSP